MSSAKILGSGEGGSPPATVQEQEPLKNVVTDANQQSMAAKKKILLQGGKQSNMLGGILNLMALKKKLGE